MLTSKKGEEIVTQEKKGATKTQICFVFMLSILGGISIWVKYSEEYNQSGKYTPLIFFAIIYCFITAGFLLRKVIKALKERKS
ncbi:MAG: hypothetical protein UV60_C0008G0029 [Parcubacteria group bacterium GW2011_GWA2_43_11]|nr:MAG: hypothetical protein UU89_C0009G0023 [Parcubacteria group bacterium GW2011_GWC2_42_11]KKS85407.1 MAG: hypothetical protein UV60_C0008G0029 [Parcubacteria group bacterium GW2011_GWA2_43_11]